MRLFFVILAVAQLSCSLRPLYRDLVPALPKGASTVQLQVVEKGTERPIANAKIELGEGKDKFLAMADEQGRFVLPVDKKHFDENALLVVATPPGYNGYSVRPLIVAAVPAEMPPTLTEEPAQPMAIDAGLTP